MRTTCPYCGHPVTGEFVTICRGCGSPVALMTPDNKAQKTLLRSQIMKRVLVSNHKPEGKPV